MAKKQVLQHFTAYLDSHHINYSTTIDEGSIQYNMVYPAITAPNKQVESCIWFHDDDAECRVYYSCIGSEVCKSSSHINDLYRLLNFINASVYLCCGNKHGLYEPKMLYTPRIYLSEDGCFDIMITTIINYDFYEVAPLETADYITAFCPQCLDLFTHPIFGVLADIISVDKAIELIKERLKRMEEKE